MNRSHRPHAAYLSLLLMLSCSNDSEKPTGPAAANQPPRINWVTVDPAVLAIGEQARIRVDASDPDQETIRAAYTSQLGSVTPEGNTLTGVYWPALAGRDLITVVVTDARGAEARVETYATVNSSQTPGTDDGPPPAISFAPPPSSNGTIVVGQDETLRVNLCGEGAASYRIIWGDGTDDATTCRATHAYTSSGRFLLTVQGSGGALGQMRLASPFFAQFPVSVIPPGGPGPRPSD